MVDTGAQERQSNVRAADRQASELATTEGLDASEARGPVLRRSFWAALAAAVVVATLAIAVPTGMATSGNPPTSTATSARTVDVSPTTKVPDASLPATTTVTTPPSPATTVAPSTPATAPAPSVAALVAQVEAAGIVPAPTWNWSMGDTAAPCGVTSSIGGAAGCTTWSSGVEHTEFTGSPTVALVAHEVANAEVAQSALPALLEEVSSAAAGTSWSPTDAVASCLVAHFMGFQDGVAGSWQCPPALAASVAAHIHDTIVTTQTTAVCGTSSGIASTLTFTANSGTLTVTSPSTTQTAAAGTPVTVSGIGTFTARDLGGTATEAGVCED